MLTMFQDETTRAIETILTAAGCRKSERKAKRHEWTLGFHVNRFSDGGILIDFCSNDLSLNSSYTRKVAEMYDRYAEALATAGYTFTRTPEGLTIAG